MLNQLLSLYIESLIITSIGVLVASAIWIGLRAARKTDKTAKERQLHLYDILLIDIMTIPVLTFAVIEFCLFFEQDNCKIVQLELESR